MSTANTGLTPLPGSSVGPVNTCHSSHVVHFYSDDLLFLDELSRYIGIALGAGDAAIIVASPMHREGLLRRLKAKGFDTAATIRQGRFVLLDAEETLCKFMIHDSPDETRFVEVVGDIVKRVQACAENSDSRIVIFGEMVALLWRDGKAEAAIQLEQLWNRLAKILSFSLRCAYPLNGFYGQEHSKSFLRICDEHGDGVIPSESYTSLSTEHDRLRNVADLQQKAGALQAERELHEALRIAHSRLEKEIAERKEAERKLSNSEQSLRKLSADLLRTQDDERRRVGMELHDTVGQYLAALKMGLDRFEGDRSNPSTASRQFEECLHLAEKCIQEVRTMSYLLYPPMLDELGLKTAIPWYLEGFSKRSGIRTTRDIPERFPRVSRDLELTIFRVLQEALTNVHRHSESPVAHVRLAIEGQIVQLEISDQGKGMPPELLGKDSDSSGKFGVGLRGMHERVRHLDGTIEITSSAAGTTLSFSFPYENRASSPKTNLIEIPSLHNGHSNGVSGQPAKESAD